MRKFDFKQKDNNELIEIQALIMKLMAENYTISKIMILLGLSYTQINSFLEYKFKQPVITIQPKQFYVESERDFEKGVTNYTYEDLSPAEQAIFNNLDK
jgi:hypothetical protein